MIIRIVFGYLLFLQSPYSGSLAQAEWYERKKLAEVTVRAGKFALTMGFEKDGKIFLYPEEALYLLETVSERVM